MATPRPNRRATILVVTAALVVLLLAVAWLLPVPYVSMAPGPTENTLGKVNGRPIVQIDHRTYPTRGALDLTTVAVTGPTQRLPLLTALGAWLDPRVAVVPRSYIYPEGFTPQQVEQQNAEEMTGSQESAIAAAEREVGLTVPRSVVVRAVLEDAPAVHRLRAGDRIEAVDGRRVRGPQDVVDLVREHRPGEVVRFSVRRHGRLRQVAVTAAATPGHPHQPRVGIQVGNGFDFPVRVSVNLGENIGGPSAGTMFALAIVDKLTPGPLTAGRHVAGTGTIAPSGKVGPIGGIQQKVAGARRSGATVFLAPAADCPAAAAAGVEGIRLVKVTTLHSAVRALRVLGRSGSDRATVPSCRG